MAEHLERIDLVLLDHFKEFVPVKLNGCLSVSDQANTTFHQGANVEVVGLKMKVSAIQQY